MAETLIPSTITEKILARAAGLPRVAAGEEITYTPDFVMAYELRGVTDKLQDNLSARLGVERLRSPEKFIMFIDHRVPSRLPEDEALHEKTRLWSHQHGVKLYDRGGIGHQVAVEEGYAVPGSVSVHFDAHVMQIGAYGALGFGIRSQLIQAFSQERVTMAVPASARVRFTGRLMPWCDARDVFHALVLAVGPDGCAFKVLEFDDRHLGGLTREDLQMITGMMMFTGAVSAIVNPGGGEEAPTAPAARASLPVMRSDEAARYEPDLWLDLSRVEPSIAVPPTPAEVRPIGGLLGQPVQAGYLGSCASGRLGDLRAAARVLAGRRIAPGFSLNVVPSSQAIMAQASREGTLAQLVDAGAFISSPSCDYCSGYAGVMSAGQRAVSTGTLNVPGRMGHTDAEIYLCSPYVLAATALHGVLTDPRALEQSHA